MENKELRKGPQTAGIGNAYDHFAKRVARLQRDEAGAALYEAALAGVRLVQSRSGDSGGAVLAIAFFCVSLTPSLLPRN